MTDTLSTVLAFGEITFPILLLVPTLITAFRKFLVPPIELGRFFSWLLFFYFTVLEAAILSALIQGAWGSFGLLIVCAIPATIGVDNVVRWTLHEQVEIWLDSQRPRLE